MYNRANLIRQKRSKQREYERIKAKYRNSVPRNFNDPELETLKKEIDFIYMKLQKI